MKEKKHIEYSKILATASLIIFIVTLLASLGFMGYLMLYTDVTLIDTAIFATSISVTGSIYALTAKHYYNKAMMQNCANIRKGVYSEILNCRLSYNKEMIKLQNSYELTNEDIQDIDMENPFNEMSETALGRIGNKLDEVDDTSSVDVEYEEM